MEIDIGWYAPWVILIIIILVWLIYYVNKKNRYLWQIIDSHGINVQEQMSSLERGESIQAKKKAPNPYSSRENYRTPPRAVREARHRVLGEAITWDTSE